MLAAVKHMRQHCIMQFHRDAVIVNPDRSQVLHALRQRELPLAEIRAQFLRGDQLMLAVFDERHVQIIPPCPRFYNESK